MKYRFYVTTPDNLFVANIFVECSSSSPLEAAKQALQQTSTPEFESRNGRGCRVQLTGVDVCAECLQVPCIC